jgi:hypothetical protein
VGSPAPYGQDPNQHSEAKRDSNRGVRVGVNRPICGLRVFRGLVLEFVVGCLRCFHGGISGRARLPGELLGGAFHMLNVIFNSLNGFNSFISHKRFLLQVVRRQVTVNHGNPFPSGAMLFLS